MKCSCKHDFQDEKYGKGNRVFNQGGSKENPKFRCIVCAVQSQTAIVKK